MHISLFNGWLIVDKPLGMSSTQVVSFVRKILKVKKIGHAGTLDPLASGVLPLAIGEATKTVFYIQNSLKTYEFEIKWGEARSTDDAEGEIIETSSLIPSESQIQTALPQFLGEIDQLPPSYSALKINGQRAYALARQGKKVCLKSRKAWIEAFDLIETQKKSASFRVICGKGTYVRALARDLAQVLGTVGYVSALRRTQVGKFFEKNSSSCEKILELGPQIALQRSWYSIGEALDDILAIPLTSQQEHLLRKGQAIEYTDNKTCSQMVLCIRNKRVPVAIAHLLDNRIVPERVFNID